MSVCSVISACCGIVSQGSTAKNLVRKNTSRILSDVRAETKIKIYPGRDRRSQSRNSGARLSLLRAERAIHLRRRVRRVDEAARKTGSGASRSHHARQPDTTGFGTSL